MATPAPPRALPTPTRRRPVGPSARVAREGAPRRHTRTDGRPGRRALPGGPARLRRARPRAPPRARPQGRRRGRSGAARGASASARWRWTSRRSPGASTPAPSPRPSSRRRSWRPRHGARARTWFLVNGASQANHVALLTLAHAGERVVVQRNAHSSTIDGCILAGLTPTFVAPEVDPELGIAPLPGARDARRGARRRRPSAVGRDRRLAHLLRRRGRRGRPGRGGALPRRAAGGGRGLGRAPGLPRGPAGATRSRCGADIVVSSTHKIVGSLTQSAMVHLGTRPRDGSTPAWWTARSRWWSPRAPTRCCSARSTPPGGWRPRAGTSCWGRPSRRWPRCARPCARSTAWTCSTSGSWARPACTPTTRCGWRSTCAAPAPAATSSRRCCASAAA